MFKELNMEYKYRLEAMSDDELSSLVVKSFVYYHHGFSITCYCTMMPILIEHGIELSPLFRGEWVASEVSSYTYEEDPIYGHQSVHANPLRAGAIVYLLMKGEFSEEQN